MADFYPESDHRSLVYAGIPDAPVKPLLTWIVVMRPFGFNPLQAYETNFCVVEATDEIDAVMRVQDLDIWTKNEVVGATMLRLTELRNGVKIVVKPEFSW